MFAGAAPVIMVPFLYPGLVLYKHKRIYRPQLKDAALERCMRKFAVLFLICVPEKIAFRTIKCYFPC